MFLILIILTAIPSCAVYAQSATLNSALIAIQNAFAQVSRAESQGANVTQQVSELNQALQLVQMGENENSTVSEQYYSQAINLATQVVQQLPQATRQGQAAAQLELTWLGLLLGGLAAAGIIVYFFGSMVFWRLWVRTHRGWMVRKNEEVS